MALKVKVKISAKGDDALKKPLVVSVAHHKPSHQAGFKSLFK